MQQQGVVRVSFLLTKGTPKMLSEVLGTTPVKTFKSEDRYYTVYEVPLPVIMANTAYHGDRSVFSTSDPRLHVEYLGANWPTGERALLTFPVITVFGKETTIHR